MLGRAKVRPADQLPNGVVVEAGATVETVGVYRTLRGLVGAGGRVPDGHVGGLGAGPGYVGGLAGVDPAVPRTHPGHRQAGPLPEQFLCSTCGDQTGPTYFLVWMLASWLVRRAPSLYQAMAGGGTARLVTWWIWGLLQFNFKFTLTTNFRYHGLGDLNLEPATLCACAGREQLTIIKIVINFL